MCKDSVWGTVALVENAIGEVEQVGIPGVWPVPDQDLIGRSYLQAVLHASHHRILPRVRSHAALCLPALRNLLTAASLCGDRPKCTERAPVARCTLGTEPGGDRLGRDVCDPHVAQPLDSHRSLCPVPPCLGQGRPLPETFPPRQCPCHIQAHMLSCPHRCDGTPAAVWAGRALLRWHLVSRRRVWIA
jgi:hypothetical protein